jgi:hypothetical protein
MVEDWMNGRRECDMRERKNISRKEYLQFLNVALGSLGESVSGTYVYRRADQISEEEFEQWDALAFKLENGMKRLIESLQHKQANNDWQDSFILKESNAAYGGEIVERLDDTLP